MVNPPSTEPANRAEPLEVFGDLGWLLPRDHAELLGLCARPTAARRPSSWRLGQPGNAPVRMHQRHRLTAWRDLRLSRFLRFGREANGTSGRMARRPRRRKRRTAGAGARRIRPGSRGDTSSPVCPRRMSNRVRFRPAFADVRLGRFQVHQVADAAAMQPVQARTASDAIVAHARTIQRSVQACDCEACENSSC